MKHVYRKIATAVLSSMLVFSTIPAMSTPVWAADTAITTNGDGVFGDDDYQVLINMIGAVETGGNQYGQRDYSMYIEPQAGAETTISLGWFCSYGNNARELLKAISAANPTLFTSTDKDGSLAKALTTDWEKTSWIPNADQKQEIIQLISSDTGKTCQDQSFKNYTSTLISACENNYTSNPGAIMMYCEIGILGWTGPANRIFNRVVNDYSSNFSIDCIMAALQDDQNDMDDADGTLVSDPMYNSRHQAIYNWIKEYVPDATWGGVDTSRTSTPQQAIFSDVQDTSAFYYTPVYWAVKNNITTGISSTTFGPTDTCTRAQIVTLLYKMFGDGENDADAGFTDVSSDKWYYQAVNWAKANHITAGNSKSTFSPNQKCTRAQIVTFLYNALADKSITYQQSFSDVPSNAWYANAVAWAVSNNITSGTGGSSFSPNETCNRGQAITFLYRTRNL